MKSLNKYNWRVTIEYDAVRFNGYYWIARSTEDGEVVEGFSGYKTKGEAIGNWKRFAKLNEVHVTKYTIIED